MKRMAICLLFILAGCSSLQERIPPEFVVDSADVANSALQSNAAFDIFKKAALDAAGTEEDKEILDQLGNKVKEDLQDLWLKAKAHATSVKENRTPKEEVEE